ncbi:lasso peptide biosynthesis B2 protein [Massilia solisilvae]|uniref:Lasso peptide biosynthesis B2 protein n=1 Tax=Massilia solisilvae TaxID=1811225 RepID=A0ABT2BE46_9BURK|nr:lasso peptide biosynthesis B2 protein [Massilia solisilvae]MCS0606794.1 lasso peptide biosynthesis B2 protein [Massilia solisilvae]
MLPALVRKGRSFARLPLFTQLWLTPSWVLLGVSRALILTLSFPRLARLLGHPLGVATSVPLVSARQCERARQVGRTIRLAARYTPWDSNCFAQALTARLLLATHRVPCAMYFGLKRDSDGMKAHAWVASGPVAVSGGSSFGRYTIVGAFASEPALRP